MANFDEFLPTLLEHEGGFVDHPKDPGGATNKGITFKTFVNVAKRYLDIEPTLENLKSLTDEQAAIIYKKHYWDKIKGDQYESQELANIVFDFYVNAGANATRLLQNELNEFGADIDVDGAIGPFTLQAINVVPQVALYNGYKEARRNYYRELVERNPHLNVFLKGWLNRVETFPDL